MQPLPHNQPTNVTMHKNINALFVTNLAHIRKDIYMQECFIGPCLGCKAVVNPVYLKCRI